MKRVISRYPNDVKDWWRQTLDDIKWAEHDLGGGFYTQVCFISQQIAEKALKAFLLANNIIVEKGHKLPLLLRQAGAIDEEFIKFKNHAKKLDRYYFGTRYPPSLGPEGGYTEKEAVEALSLAKELVEFVSKRVINK